MKSKSYKKVILKIPKILWFLLVSKIHVNDVSELYCKEQIHILFQENKLFFFNKKINLYHEI